MSYKKTMMFLQELLDDDMVFYIGDSIISFLSKDTVLAYNTFTVTDTNLDYISIAIGMAMNTDKKVTVVLDNNYLFKHYSSLLQAAVSKCSNLFFILIVTNNYKAEINQSNLYKSFSSMKGSMYELGFLTHTHTRFFNNKKDFNKFKLLYDRFIGPAMGIIEVDNSKKIDNSFAVENNITTFIDFTRYTFSEEEVINKDSIELVIKEN